MDKSVNIMEVALKQGKRKWKPCVIDSKILAENWSAELRRRIAEPQT